MSYVFFEMRTESSYILYIRKKFRPLYKEIEQLEFYESFTHWNMN